MLALDFPRTTPTPPMSTDPLSNTTRATKRNLLVLSVLAITYRAFDVTVDRVPVTGGLSITLDPRVIVFLVSLCLLYFFCTFVLYYFIDMKNITPSSHQAKSKSSYLDNVSSFSNKQESVYLKRLERLHPDKIFSSPNNITIILRRIESGSVFQLTGGGAPSIVSSFEIHTRSQMHVSDSKLQFENNRPLYFQVSLELRRMMRGYKKQFLISNGANLFALYLLGPSILFETTQSTDFFRSRSLSLQDSHSIISFRLNGCDTSHLRNEIVNQRNAGFAAPRRLWNTTWDTPIRSKLICLYRCQLQQSAYGGRGRPNGRWPRPRKLVPILKSSGPTPPAPIAAANGPLPIALFAMPPLPNRLGSRDTPKVGAIRRSSAVRRSGTFCKFLTSSKVSYMSSSEGRCFAVGAVGSAMIF